MGYHLSSDTRCWIYSTGKGDGKTDENLGKMGEPWRAHHQVPPTRRPVPASACAPCAPPGKAGGKSMGKFNGPRKSKYCLVVGHLIQLDMLTVVNCFYVRKVNACVPKPMHLPGCQRNPLRSFNSSMSHLTSHICLCGAKTLPVWGSLIVQIWRLI